MNVLIVRDPFGDYAKGQVLRDADEIATVIDAGQAVFCTLADIDETFFATEPAAEPAPPAPKKGRAAPDPAAAPQS